MKTSRIQALIIIAVSTILTLSALELFARVLNPQKGRIEYHSRLGWIPSPGKFGGSWVSNVNEFTFRSTGWDSSISDRPLLVVGDSFAFGDEVADDETWPSYLEQLTSKQVINAGVGAYGIDQAYLRAELLLRTYEPEVVILSFISDDINRTEYSYYPYGRGWKPYFDLSDGVLQLRNVPVPESHINDVVGASILRRALGYSYLSTRIFSKLTPHWWNRHKVDNRVHNDGEAISIELLKRLTTLARRQNSTFLAVALATNGRIGGNDRLQSLVSGARANGVTVLDLSPDILDLQSEQLEGLFESGGHYSPRMNRKVAKRIASFLQREGIGAGTHLK